MYTKSLHLMSILLLNKKAGGRIGQYDVDVKDYLYINFGRSFGIAVRELNRYNIFGTHRQQSL